MVISIDKVNDLLNKIIKKSIHSIVDYRYTYIDCLYKKERLLDKEYYYVIKMENLYTLKDTDDIRLGKLIDKYINSNKILSKLFYNPSCEIKHGEVVLRLSIHLKVRVFEDYFDFKDYEIIPYSKYLKMLKRVINDNSICNIDYITGRFKTDEVKLNFYGDYKLEDIKKALELVYSSFYKEIEIEDNCIELEFDTNKLIANNKDKVLYYYADIFDKKEVVITANTNLNSIKNRLIEKLEFNNLGDYCNYTVYVENNNGINTIELDYRDYNSKDVAIMSNIIKTTINELFKIKNISYRKDKIIINI